MSIGDGLHFLAVGNPVSKAIISTTAGLFKNPSTSTATTESVKASALQATSRAVKEVMPPLWKLAGRNYNFVRLAGLSGAAAVILGAVGSHTLNPVASQDKGDARAVFETANRFHFFHSLVLLGMPMAKRPLVTGMLMITGTALFCGTLYYTAFTSDKQFARLAPIGGTCLIIAWLSLVL